MTATVEHIVPMKRGDIGMALRRQLKLLGINQAEGARRLGWTSERFSKYVLDKSQPSYSDLLKICDVLNTTPNDLFDCREKTVDGDLIARLLARVPDALRRNLIFPGPEIVASIVAEVYSEAVKYEKPEIDQIVGIAAASARHRPDVELLTE